MHDVLAEATGERVAADVVDVFLPRFAIECSHDLVEPLRSMGVRRVFTDGAELGRLSPEPLALDQARQVARVEVDEEGVKAAAVTALAMRAGAMVAPDPVVMELRFDRPFAFALLDPELDLPLFAGWLADPRS
jgi:serine protease inhibitor